MMIAGLARTAAMYVASIPVISMWNISFPAAQGIMTHHVSEREQGELQGAISSLRSIAFVIGPFLFSWTFGWFIDPRRSFQLPGAGYFLAAALLFTAAIMATRIEQPRFAIPPAGEVPDVVPPEGVTSGTVAPMIDSEENV
jgi:DHA1 family tetracycline resistance protein-like MFS transporter